MRTRNAKLARYICEKCLSLVKSHNPNVDDYDGESAFVHWQLGCLSISKSWSRSEGNSACVYIEKILFVSYHYDYNCWNDENDKNDDSGLVVLFN